MTKNPCPKCQKLKQLVDRQASDRKLWHPYNTNAEEVQKALRVLHAVIEDEKWAEHFYGDHKEDERYQQ